MFDSLLNRLANNRFSSLVKDVADLGREVIVLEVDLTDEKNRLRKTGPGAPPLSIRPMREAEEQLLSSIAHSAPERLEMVKRRLSLGMLGYVLFSEQQILGYMFYTPGATGDLNTHRDLNWLGIRPGADEVYAFDYFIEPNSRGVGASFVKLVQEEQFRLGHKKSFGYVFADNRPALWLYRITGWKEVKRLKEHRFLRNHLAVIERTLYFMHPYARTPLFSW